MTNRNLTLSLPEELVQRAKVIAAQRDISVSALVRDLLAQATRSDEADERWAQEEALMREGELLRIGAVTWPRDEVHER